MEKESSRRELSFMHGNDEIKVLVVEEAPDDGRPCCICRQPLNRSPIYVTDPPDLFEIHVKCGHERVFASASPSSAAADRKHKDRSCGTSSSSKNKDPYHYQSDCTYPPTPYHHHYHGQPYSYHPPPPTPYHHHYHGQPYAYPYPPPPQSCNEKPAKWSGSSMTPLLGSAVIGSFLQFPLETFFTGSSFEF